MKVVVYFNGGIIVEVDNSYKTLFDENISEEKSEEIYDKLLDNLYKKLNIVDGDIEDVAEY